MKQKRKHALLVSSDNPNIDSSLSKNEIDTALSDQKTQGFSWHEMGLNILIYASSESELETKTQQMISIFRNHEESSLVVEHYSQLKQFISGLPGCAHYQDHRFLVSSNNICDLSPLSIAPKGTKGLSSYLLTARQTLFRFSTFSDEFNNWNQVVIGKIGSGKSFLVNNILMQALMGLNHPRVMILDLGKSFYRTTELWGGKYISIDLDEPDCGLNPLPPHENIRPDGRKTILGLLDFTVQLLLLMAGKVNENKLEARVLRKALQITYQKITNRDPILSDLHKYLLQYRKMTRADPVDDQIATDLSKLLEEYVSGAYSQIFNRHSTFNFSTDFFCFDFKHAHSNAHIREIATYVVGGYMSRKMTENTEHKFIIFDEFATTMQHHTGAALCKMIAKNCRKHGVSFICISQELEDFLHNPAAQAVYHQSNYKWFLKMDDNLSKYQEHLRLTNEDIAIIQSLQTQKGKYAEAYLHYGDKKALLSLNPDPLTYWACTTDPNDKKMETVYRDHDQSTSLLKIIQTLSHKYPLGISSSDFQEDPIYQKRKDNS